MPKKNGFNDPIKAKDNPTRYPPDFKMPEYDKRSSCFVRAGEDFGVGYKAPVGKLGAPTMQGNAIPFGRVETMSTDEPEY